MRNQAARIRNQFGRRYITTSNFAKYAADLGLVPQAPTERFLEYLERVDLLCPIARVRFPAEIVRRFEENQYAQKVNLPVETDNLRLEIANELRNELFSGNWSHPRVSGNRQHLLDAMRLEHTEFIQKEFTPLTFIPWEELSVTILMDEDGQKFFDGGRYSPTYYHYWQIFPLASILRSATTILGPDHGTGHFGFLWSTPRLAVVDNEALAVSQRRP